MSMVTLRPVNTTVEKASVKNAWPRHGYMRQMVDVPEKN